MNLSPYLIAISALTCGRHKYNNDSSMEGTIIERRREKIARCT